MGLDPRPTVEVSLEPLRAHGPVRQSMREQDRESQATDVADVTLDPFQIGAFRISVAVVVAMVVDGPRTTAGTTRARSPEFIVALLNGR